MSTPNTGLIFHLEFAEINDGKLADASGKGNDGTPLGHPLLVPDDAFGSCLNLDGTDDYVSVPDIAADYAGGLTVEAWVFYSSLKTWSPIVSMGNGKASDNIVFNASAEQNKLALSVFRGSVVNMIETAGVLKPNEWTHVAAAVDAAGKATLYVNAAPVASGSVHLPQKIARRNNYVGRSDWPIDVYFHGKMGSVRVYNRALPAAEVRQDMADDKTASASFRASYPLTFKLFDREDNQQVVYITDHPQGRDMSFEVSNTSRKAVTLSAPAAAQVGAENYHFELRLRAGTLSADALARLALADAGWTMLKPAPNQTTQNGAGVSLYFLSAAERTLNPSDKITLTLSGVAADPGAGARGTRAELKFRGMHYPGETTPLEGTRIQHLNVVNQRGQKSIPLHVGFIDSNTVLNDGKSQNQLRLRITNVSKTSLALTPAPGNASSKLVISFDPPGDAETSKDWALGTASQVNAIQVTAPGWTPFKPEAKTPEWILTTAKTSLAPDEAIELTLVGIVSSTHSGMSNMYVHYKNIPGHWDGQFVAMIEKAPIFYRGDRVGVGTNAPEQTFHVHGRNEILTTGVGAGFKFRDRGSATTANDWVWYALSNCARLYHVGGSDLLVINQAGNVGIGAFNPSAKLTVVGTMRVTASDASAGITTRVFEGTISNGQSVALDLYALRDHRSSHLELLVMMHDVNSDVYRLYQKDDYGCYRQWDRPPQIDLLAQVYRRTYDQDIYKAEVIANGDTIQARLSQNGHAADTVYQVVARYMMVGL